MSVEKLLAERKSSHGDFVSAALTVQRMKDLLHAAPNWENMPAYQKEALEMVVHKMGRVLHGDNNFVDAYRDIIGYTQRVVEYLENTELEATDVKSIYLVRSATGWTEK